MAVIWGLDLHEMQWWKFKNSYMWNKEFHLRRTKFIVYQLAMIFCVFSESFGTKALDDYVHQQRHLEKVSSENGFEASIYNNDFVATESFNVFTGVYVATIFGSAFFFDLFWPMRKESKSVKIAWRVCSVLACAFTLASAIVITVIFSTRRAYIEGGVPDMNRVHEILDSYKYGSLKSLLYKNNPYFIVSLAFIWPGFLATVASTVVMWMSLSHNDKFGPKSAHVRKAESANPGPHSAGSEEPKHLEDSVTTAHTGHRTAGSETLSNSAEASAQDPAQASTTHHNVPSSHLAAPNAHAGTNGAKTQNGVSVG